jgi:hypothetical protein
MLSLVDPETVDGAERDKQEVVNRIIAAGLNSMSGKIGFATTLDPASPERQLLDAFVSQSFERILPCWPHLDEKIKFYIFKSNVEEFLQYMNTKSKGN